MNGTTPRSVPATLDSLREVVRTRAYVKLHWPRSEHVPKARRVLVDVLTAKAVVAVIDALESDELRAKAAAMVSHSPARFGRLVEVAWRNVRMA